MIDHIFKYKGRNLFISVFKSTDLDITFALYDADKIKETHIDFSEKELAKIELIEFFRELVNGEMAKSVVAKRTVLLKKLEKDQFNVLLKIKNDLLKEIK